MLIRAHSAVRLQVAGAAPVCVMAVPSTGGCCVSSADAGQLGWVARRVELHPGAVQHCFLPNKKNESLLLFLSVSICPVLSRSFFMERVTCAQAWRLLNISPSI